MNEKRKHQSMGTIEDKTRLERFVDTLPENKKMIMGIPYIETI